MAVYYLRQFTEFCTESEIRMAVCLYTYRWLHDYLGAVAHSCCPASQERLVLPITSLWKDQNSKFEVWFLLNVYFFCTILSQGLSVYEENNVLHPLVHPTLLRNYIYGKLKFRSWNYNTKKLNLPIRKKILWGRSYYFPHFLPGEIETCRL